MVVSTYLSGIVGYAVVSIVTLQLGGGFHHDFRRGERSIALEPLLVCPQLGAKALADGFTFHAKSSAIERVVKIEVSQTGAKLRPLAECRFRWRKRLHLFGYGP